MDCFLFDVLTKYFFNISQRFQYCGVKGTFLGIKIDSQYFDHTTYFVSKNILNKTVQTNRIDL